MSAMQPPLYQSYESNTAPERAVVPRPRGDVPAVQATRPRTLNDYRIGVQSTASRRSSPFGTAIIIGVAVVAAGAFVLLDPLHVMPGAKNTLHSTSSTTKNAATTPAPADMAMSSTATPGSVVDTAPPATTTGSTPSEVRKP